jgi:DNA-binding LytR/AlgR family response regulator
VDEQVITTLVVDDEPISRRILREALEVIPGVDIVGEAEDGKDALQQIRRLRPNLVFLDLQMPVMSGFEVVRTLEPPLPVIIIVTAFDQRAMRAFEAGAVDYLLKPINDHRLAKAVDRARSLLDDPIEMARRVTRIVAALAANDVTANRRVIGRVGDDYYVVDTDDVLAFQAEQKMVWIVTHRQRLLTTQSLRSIQERLGEPQFQRVHRNAIVNSNHIRKMSPISSQRWVVTLSNSLELTVSKRQAHKIRQVLR